MPTQNFEQIRCFISFRTKAKKENHEKNFMTRNFFRSFLAFSLGQFTRNYTQTTKRGLLTTNKG